MLHAYLSQQPRIGARAYVAPSAQLIGQVELGDDASVFFNSVLRGDINRISVGARTNIQDNSTLHVASDLACILGEDVSVGHNCVIHACTLESRILVGMGSVIMDGVHIGDDCIIGASSLLPKGKKYPAGSLIVGSPAKVVRTLTEEEKKSLLSLAFKYVGVKDNYLAADTGESRI